MSGIRSKITALTVLAFVIASFAFIAIMPVHIEGCYVNDIPLEGHNLLYFTNGHVYSCIPASETSIRLGTYAYEEEVGWVWTLAKYPRRIHVKPHFLFARFSALDDISQPATSPFLWRSLRRGRNRAVIDKLNPELRARIAGTTNTARSVSEGGVLRRTE